MINRNSLVVQARSCSDPGQEFGATCSGRRLGCALNWCRVDFEQAGVCIGAHFEGVAQGVAFEPWSVSLFLTRTSNACPVSSIAEGIWVITGMINKRSLVFKASSFSASEQEFGATCGVRLLGLPLTGD